MWYLHSGCEFCFGVCARFNAGWFVIGLEGGYFVELVEGVLFGGSH